MSAAYNLGSAITSLTYPSGRTITNSYDQAGRLTTFSGNLGDGVTRTYSSGILYAAAGALVKEQFGTAPAVYNKLFYNSRLQLAEIRMKETIEAAYSGTFERNGINFTVSAEIETAVYENEAKAVGSGKDNIAGFVSAVLVGIPGGREYGVPDTHSVAWTYRNSGESFDRMLFASGHPDVKKSKPHEFAHGLGESRHFAPGSVLGATNVTTGNQITTEDFHNLFGRSVDQHLRGRQGGFLLSFPMKFPGKNPSTHVLRKR